jgi:hypothetical protein
MPACGNHRLRERVLSEVRDGSGEGGKARGEDFPAETALPEKDRPVLAAAIAARATHLVTGDARYFGAYFGKRIRGVLVTTGADYLRTR